jgi:hypothetical protein
MQAGNPQSAEPGNSILAAPVRALFAEIGGQRRSVNSKMKHGA